MWFILLFAACTMAIPIAFEIHYKGSDNILNRSGREILNRSGQKLSRSPLIRGPFKILEELGSWAVSIGVVSFWVIVFLSAWTLISSLLKLFS